MKIGLIFLSGGTGTRMQAEKPKQYLELGGKPIARHSFNCLLDMEIFEEIAVVCHPSYCTIFPEANDFAEPGQRRQDSVYNGLLKLSSDCSLVLVHDSARPFISEALVNRVVEAAAQHGAATCGLPVPFTVKETTREQFVSRTPDRSVIYEIQTPQVINYQLLIDGFSLANSKNITVTDDVSLVELLGHPVKIVEGSRANFKITTPEDLLFAKSLLDHAKI